MYGLIRPLLFSLDAERAHNLTFQLLTTTGSVAKTAAGTLFGPASPKLSTQVGRVSFAGPVGLAAGLDKNAEATAFWPSIGFGFVEVGTVTAKGQPGNPLPRLFRFPEHEAIVNRMGFNNHGARAMAEKLRATRQDWNSPAAVGVNLGKSKVTPLEEAVDDYVESTKALAEFADYLVINVSSPNTPGLRQLQDETALREIIQGVLSVAQDTPVFVKLAPDLENEALDSLIRVADEEALEGLIATNTTIDHQGIAKVGPGGLSGRPLARRSQEVVAYLCERTSKPVIAVGGISSPSDAMEMFRLGASAIQIYSALVFQGPALIGAINKSLLKEMKLRGCATFDELRTELRG